MAARPQSAGEFKKIKLVAGQIARIKAVLDPKWKDVTGKLDGAIKAGNGAKIELYLSALDGRIKEVTKALHAARVAMGEVRELQLDEDFVAENLAAVDAAVSILSEAVTGFTAQFIQGKKLQNQAEAAADSARDASGQATAGQSELEGEMEDIKTSLSALFRKSDAIQVRAVAAVKARDAKALDKARKEYDALDIEVELFQFDGLMKRVKALAASAGSKDHSPEVQAQLKDGARDLMNQATGVKVYVEQLRLGIERMKALKVEAVDVGKAAKLLSIDRAGEAALRKVLQGPPAGLDAGLEQIGKKLEPKQKGKDMLAKLKTAGIV
jgi:hypothetical protein